VTTVLDVSQLASYLCIRCAKYLINGCLIILTMTKISLYSEGADTYGPPKVSTPGQYPSGVRK